MKEIHHHHPQIYVAKASEEECKAIQVYLQTLEDLIDNNDVPSGAEPADYDVIGQFLVRDYDTIRDSWERLLLAYRTLQHCATDQKLTYLAYNRDITEAIDLWERWNRLPCCVQYVIGKLFWRTFHGANFWTRWYYGK